MKDGFVYVATGSNYVAEAFVSAQSLRDHMPTAAVVLITDLEPTKEILSAFDQILIRTDVRRQPIDKLLCWEAPFERCIFLDTDTLVGGDLSELFSLLDRFDLAVAHETLRGLHYRLPDVPNSFPEYNTGVIVFRRNVTTENFFREWRRRFELLANSQGFVTDQPSFRLAAYETEAHIAVLPSEYHFIAGTPNYTMWQVLILHGRGDLPGLLEGLNAKLGARAYVPQLGPIYGFNGRQGWIRQTYRLLCRNLAKLFRSREQDRQPFKDSWHKIEEERKTRILEKDNVSAED